MKPSIEMVRWKDGVSNNRSKAGLLSRRMQSLINAFEECLEGLSLGTRKNYISDSIQFLSWLMKIGKDVEDVHLHDYLEYLQLEKHNLRQGVSGKYADTTIRRKITSIRQFYKILTHRQIIQKNQARELPTLPVVRQRHHSIKTLDLQSVRTMFNLPNQSSPIGVRDKTILSVMVLAGLSVSEVRLLKIDDVNIEEKTLTVTGRCSKKRIINLTDQVTKQVQRWLSVRTLLGITDSAVFPLLRSHKNGSGVRRVSRRVLR